MSMTASNEPISNSKGTRLALGFRAHSGWAVLVAVAASRGQGASSTPLVIDRRRMDLVSNGIPPQPYHAAAELDLERAEELIARCAEEARRLAREALCATLEGLRQRGYHPIGSGILLSSGRSATTLAATLASHALIHTAEGELFRDAIAHASEYCGLPITKIRERELYFRASAELGLTTGAIRRQTTELGRPVGSPWRQDEKYAALVAWLALSGAP